MLLAFWPLNWFLLAFIAPAPLLWELSRRRAWSAWRAGLTYGFVFMVGQFWWLLHLTDRWVGSSTLGLLPIVIASFLSALFWFAPMGWLISKCWRLDRPWLIPFVWSGVEIIRALCPALAYPWGIVGSTLSDVAPMIQLAWFGSVFAVSAWIVLPSVMIAASRAGMAIGRIQKLGLCFAALALLSVGRYLVPIRGEETLVVAGQPGVDWAFDKTQAEWEQHRQVHLAHVGDIIADAANRRAKLLVLPEGANGNSQFPVHPDFALDPGLPTLFGSHRTVRQGETYQSAYLAEGRRYQWADKTRLVIFGEFVPGRDVIPFLDKFDLPTGDVLASTNVVNLRAKEMTIAPLICFEALFPDIAYHHARMGADIVAILSIDDWFAETAAMEQLRSGAVFRAVETGMPVVRSAQTGYSMVVDQRGNVLGQAPLNEMASVPAKVKIKGEGPFVFLPLFPAVALGSLIYAALAKPRSDSEGEEETPESD